jgi:hypothetical protein
MTLSTAGADIARLAVPQVTLVAVDGTPNAAKTWASLRRSSASMRFGRVLLLSTMKPDGFDEASDACEWASVPPMTLKGYNQFCLSQLHRHIETSHCLTVQSDSYILNPAAWDDRWLTYDYIGAPWPPGHTGTEYRVGNSGFCLRSKRLLEATAPLPNETMVWRGELKPTCRDDVITCVNCRAALEAEGLVYAPVDVAARFAFENPTPEAPVVDGQFGVHEHARSRRRRDVPLASVR